MTTQILIELDPLDPGTGSRVTMRCASADDRRILAASGERWWPTIARRPTLQHEWFDGDFTGTIRTGRAGFVLAMYGMKRQRSDAADLRYAAAPVRIYTIDPAVGTPVLVFRGICSSFGNAQEQFTVEANVDTEPFEASALTLTYAGTGGAEGPADLKNRVKPWAFGAPKGVEPVLIDATNSVFQVSGYGPINGVTALFEKASDYGASIGDYANYAALVAATIPPGRWGTCLAEGMIRLGAPPAGLITADVQGDKPSGTWIRRTGAIVSRILANAGVSSGDIDAASLAALDTAVARNVSIYLTEQTTIMDLVQRLARPCNAAAGVSWLGKLFITRTVFQTASVTLDAAARQRPAVQECAEVAVAPPFHRIEVGGDRCWRPHQIDEIGYYAEIIDLGDYAGGTTYREGNIVTNQGARWLYINPAPTAGNAPPTLPTTSNSWWEQLTGRTDYADIIGDDRPDDGATRGDNLILNSLLLTDTTGWTVNPGVIRVPGLATDPASYFQFPTRAPGQGDFVDSNTFDLLNATTLYGSGWSFEVGGGTGVFELIVLFYDATGATTGLPAFGASLLTATDNVWTPFEIKVPIPAGAVRAKFRAATDSRTTIVNVAAVRVSSLQLGADVTAANAPVIVPPATVVIRTDSSFAALSGQLARNAQFRLFVGGVDVTTAAAWTRTAVNHTSTIGASTGVLNITAVTADGRADVEAVYQGRTYKATVGIVRQPEPAPSAGGGGSGGAGSASGTISFVTSSTSYGSPALSLTFTAGSGGSVALAAAASFSTGTPGVILGAAGKWQWRIVGGSWADVTGGQGFHSASATDDGMGNAELGIIEVNRTQAGLTPGSDYEVQFLLLSGQSGVTGSFGGGGSAVAT